MLHDNLYKVISIDENRVVIKLSDKEHPLFKAHFPDMPLLPGFINFDIVEKLFKIKITTIKRAKFLKPALPDQVLTYERKNNSFKVLNENGIVASFSL